MDDYVCCDVTASNGFRLYVKRKANKSVEYRFGSSLQADVLSIAGGYKSPQEAIKAWLEDLPEQKRAVTSELNTSVTELNHNLDSFNEALHGLNSQLDKTIIAARELNKALAKIANREI